MGKVWTFNIAGGTSYNGSNLIKAIENALSHFGDGYIHCEKGKRPVIECYADDGNTSCILIGEFGQSLDDLSNQYQN